QEIGEASNEPIATRQIAIISSPARCQRRARTRAATAAAALSPKVTDEGGCGSRSSRAETPRIDWFVTYAIPPTRSGSNMWIVQKSHDARGCTAKPTATVAAKLAAAVAAARSCLVTRK